MIISNAFQIDTLMTHNTLYMVLSEYFHCASDHSLRLKRYRTSGTLILELWGEAVEEKKLCPLKWYNCLSIFSWMRSSLLILALPWSCDKFWFHSATLLECSNCLSSACILCIEGCFAMLIWRGHSAVSFFQKESIRVNRYSIMLLVFRSTQTVCIKRNEYR